MKIKLADLAIRYGCTLKGDPDATVDRVSSLRDSSPGSLCFLANSGYQHYLKDSKATAIILEEKYVGDAPENCLITHNPHAVYALIAQELHPAPLAQPGVHASVVVGSDCEIASSCEISAGVVLGDRVTLSEAVFLGPNCVIGDDVSIGSYTRFHSNVSCYSDVKIGERCIIHSSAVLGSDGFGIAQDESGWVKVPQIGGVRIGDDVEIGAGTTIDRGAIEDTCLGNDVKIDNQVQIAHNVTIGDHTAIAGQSGIAGSSKIGARCLLGGQTAIVGHLTIADDVVLMGGSTISHSVKTPGVYSSILPAEAAPSWRRILARIKQLDSLAKRLIKLEKQSESQD